jgi:hypothetical protein
MTYSFLQDVPIDAAFYQRIRDQLGDEPSPGFILHVAMERPEGGLRYLDVWETQADHERFVEERLHPVVHDLLRDLFGDDLPPEPELVAQSVIDVWHA